MRVDQRQFAGKAGAAEVPCDHRADRASLTSPIRPSERV
jgi:hypothetical protein